MEVYNYFNKILEFGQTNDSFDLMKTQIKGIIRFQSE